MRLRLLVSYIGTAYHGWQIQSREPWGTTIQGQLENALGVLAREPVRAFGSGRTDSGVHALGQAVHCDIPDARAASVRDWRNALNALLPRDIRILQAEFTRPDFHVRIDAIDKTYRYRFWQERGYVPPMLAPYVWTCGPMDVGAMRKGLSALTGTHDFASFANTGTDVSDTVRTIIHAEIAEVPPLPWLPPAMPELALTITGTGFLKQMVRNIAGLLALIGRSRLSPERVPEILAAGSRKALPSATAPACGLVLLNVRYPANDAWQFQGGSHDMR